MGFLYKMLVAVASVTLILLVGISGWLFLYTRDLPDFEHLSQFAPATQSVVSDACLDSPSTSIPFKLIGKPSSDALSTAEPSSHSDQIARSLLCNHSGGMGKYHLNAFRLSWHIRTHFSEQELFTIYANRAYFGPGATGIQNASQHLFQKDANSLKAEEAALLAGLLRAPAVFSPFRYPEKALQRRNKILEMMAAQGELNATELARAEGTPIIIRSGGNTEEKPLPHGVLEALASDKSEYCDEFDGYFKNGCEETFRVNLKWTQLGVVPRGVPAILVENNNAGFCGSAGCALRLFIMQRNGQFVQTLGTDGEVGRLAEIQLLKTVTDGHYDIQKTWADGTTNTIYRWRGSAYSAD